MHFYSPFEVNGVIPDFREMLKLIDFAHF